MMFTACTPDDHELGAIDVVADDLVEGIAFSITHDAQNPNIVYLENKMPGNYQVMWEHPQGRSLDNKVTLKIPFAGDYEVKFGVQTRGGYVFSNPAKFSVQEMCAEFISDPMWAMVAGGAGKSKTWVLDLDADAVSRYFMAPMYFFTADYNWDNLHNASGADYLSDGWDAATAIVPNLTDGAATWYWLADYPGNSWMCEAADFGTMTFDLIGGANVVTAQTNKSEMSGSYMLDTEAHTIKFSGAWPICPDARYGEMEAAPGRVFNILYLTEDAMQLLIPQTGTCLNFISKEYKENWTPGETVDPEPVLPDGWKDDVSQTVITSVKWVLSDKNPLDWCGLDGSRMNGWNAPEDYPDWLGTPDPAVYESFSMTLDSEGNAATFTYSDGSSVSCTYTLDEKGIYTFDAAIPGQTVIGWASFALDFNNQLRIMSIEKDAMGKVSGMWLGARAADKPEYTAYHFIPQAGSSAGGDDDPLKPWKKALCGKTFTPNTSAFCDWLNFDLSGGWTTPSSFGSDYSSNGWIWTEAVETICKSAKLSFAEEGGEIVATLVQDVYDANGALVEAAKSVSGVVVINPDIPTLTFSFPMVDYTGTPASWVNRDNSAFGSYWTTPLDVNEWIWVSHQNVGNNLGNVDEKGFWLGTLSGAAAAGGKDEVLAYWWVLATE